MAVEHSAAPRKRPRQRRAHETVDRILDAAAHIFDQRGYRATTTNHVAEQAGVSIGSLYQYFPNKDALLVALAERHIRVAAEAFAGRLIELRRDEPSMSDVTRSLVELSLTQNDTSRLHTVIYADSPRTPELMAELDRFTDHLIDEIAFHLERTGSGGTDPRRRASLIVSAVDAAVHEVVLGLDPGHDREAAVDDLITWVVHGLARTGPGGAGP